MRILEAVRRFVPKAKFLQASSSEIFGTAADNPQNEKTPFHPRSPYGVAKAFAHHATTNYRESYGLFACSSICFNHESPRRGTEFVFRKVSQYVARVKLGLAEKLKLGNLNVQRDWGYAGDYVRAMWLMLQQCKPDDYIIATGESHSIEELLNTAFSIAGLCWQDHVEVDPKLVRPADIGDSASVFNRDYGSRRQRTAEGPVGLALGVVAALPGRHQRRSNAEGTRLPRRLRRVASAHVTGRRRQRPTHRAPPTPSW